MADLKKFLQDLYDDDPDEFETELIYLLDFRDLPIAISGDEEPNEDYEEEQVDFENSENTNNKIVIQ